MITESHAKLINLLNENVEPCVEAEGRFDILLENIGNSHIVLIGEASHGTEEFYQARAEITRELITKKGFMAVAIEGDWPDVYPIYRYIKGRENKQNLLQCLEGFKRFPRWMWRNRTIPPFIDWLRNRNDTIKNPAEKVGIYGLDLYSFETSIQEVINYLSKIDPDAAERAKKRYDCFDQLNKTPQTYGYLVSNNIKGNCIKEVTEQLIELQYRAFDYVLNDDIAKEDEYFFAAQNARVVKDAEKYYRAMFEDYNLSWNVRDTHMADTIHILCNHLENRLKRPAKIIIWAHNSHLGDARATEMSERGEINLGQLLKEKYESTYAIGFSTNTGFVTAASNWGESPQIKKLNPGIPGSYEHLFHQLKHKNFLLNLNNKQIRHSLHIPRLQRAIGVLYHPQTERESHYFFTNLPNQFNSIIHFDQTNAVEPLDRD